MRSMVKAGHAVELNKCIQNALEIQSSIGRGHLMSAILSAFDMPELTGLDATPIDVLSPLEDTGQQDSFVAARREIMQLLRKQISKRNTFFINVDLLLTTEAAIYIKDIVNTRREEIEEFCEEEFTLEGLASTYYGFMLVTSQVREKGSVGNLRKLLECLELDRDIRTEAQLHSLNPEKVVFSNVSGETEEVLKCILCLTGHNSGERAKAATRLGELADPRTEQHLARATKDEHAWVRRAAVVALGQIRPIREPRSLVDALKDFDDETRRAALESTVSVGQSAVPLLLDMLKNYREIPYSEALEAARKSHPRSLDNLEAALRYNSCTARTLAALALGRIGDKRAISGLQNALLDEEQEVRCAAQKSLAALGET